MLATICQGIEGMFMQQDAGESTVTIGDSTRLRLGLLVSIFFGVVGGLFAGVWWAATLSSKVDYIIEGYSSSRNQITISSQHIAELQQLVQKLEWKVTAAELRLTAQEQKPK